MKRVIIIYEKGGMCHLRNAEILADILRERLGVQVECMTGSEFLGGAKSEWAAKAWNVLVRWNLIGVADKLLNGFTRAWLLPIMEVFEHKRLSDRIDHFAPDAIVNNADGYTRTMAVSAHKKNIPFFTILTESSVFIDMVSPYATHFCYFMETANAVARFDGLSAVSDAALISSGRKLRYIVKCYANRIFRRRSRPCYVSCKGKIVRRNTFSCVPLGPFAARKHYEKHDLASIRGKLGARDDAPVVTIMSGSIGGLFLLKAAKALCHQAEPLLNLAVICGNDGETLGKVRHLREGKPPHEILPFGYVDNCDEILAASSCAVIRPSAGTFNECMISRTPVVCRAYTASNDQGTVELITRYGLGATYDDEREIPGLVRRILENQAEYVGNINSFLSHYPSDYESIADRLVAEFEKAAESGRERSRRRMAV